MNCVRCNAENPASSKFCRSCGGVLGTLCSRCGTAAHPDDHYCTSCGLDLSQRGGADMMRTSRNQSSVMSQYSPQEIEELLALRKTTRRETDSTKTLKQDDVDKLFE